MLFQTTIFSLLLEMHYDYSFLFFLVPFQRVKSYASPWPVRLALPFPDESLLLLLCCFLVAVVVFVVVVSLLILMPARCGAPLFCRLLLKNEKMQRAARGTLHILQIPHRQRGRAAAAAAF